MTEGVILAWQLCLANGWCVSFRRDLPYLKSSISLCSLAGWASQLKDHPVLIPKLLLRNAYFLISADAGPVAVFFSIEDSSFFLLAWHAWQHVFGWERGTYHLVCQWNQWRKSLLQTSQNWRDGAPINSHTSDVKHDISPIGYIYYNYWRTPARKSNGALELKEHVIWSAAWQTRVQHVSC